MQAIRATALATLGLLCAAGTASAGGITLVNPKAKKRKATGITISGKGKKLSVTGRIATKPRRAGHVLIALKNADLKTVVLPLFKKQAGVTIKYRGKPRKVTLRLTEAIPWEEALALVSQFTGTHLSEDYTGGLLLKARWGGEVDEKVVFDTLDGQVHTPHHLQASVRRRNFKRTIPVVRPRKPLPMITIGGHKGTLRPPGRPAQPYVGRPYVGRPYVGKPYVGKPYVGRAQPAKRYEGARQPAKRYEGRPYRSAPYQSPARGPKKTTPTNTRRPQPYRNDRGQRAAKPWPSGF